MTIDHGFILPHAPIGVRERPIPVRGDYRPVWRMALVCVLVERCYGSRASLVQLHILNWAVRYPDHWRMFCSAIDGDRSPLLLPVAIEPALSRALRLAEAEGLIDLRNGKRLHLMPKGEEFLERIKQTNVLQSEKRRLAELGRKFTQADATRFFLSNRSI